MRELEDMAWRVRRACRALEERASFHLNPVEVQTVRLRQQGLSYAEIAEAHSVTPGKVRQRLLIALDELDPPYRALKDTPEAFYRYERWSERGSTMARRS